MRYRPTAVHVELIAQGSPSSLAGDDLPARFVQTRLQPSELDYPESVPGLKRGPARSPKDGLL